MKKISAILAAILAAMTLAGCSEKKEPSNDREPAASINTPVDPGNTPVDPGNTPADPVNTPADPANDPAPSDGTNEKVKEANSLAEGVQRIISSFFINCETVRCGMKQGNSVAIGIAASSDGEWILNLNPFDPDAFDSHGNKAWKSKDVSGVYANSSKSDDLTYNLAVEVASMYPDVRNVAFMALVVSGKCTLVTCTDDALNAATLGYLTADLLDDDGSKLVSSAKWNGTTAGVTPDGLIVGTAPVVGLS